MELSADVEAKVRYQARKAIELQRRLDTWTKWYERAIFTAVIAVSTFVPLGVGLKLNFAACRLLTGNPKHRYAVETMPLLSGQAASPRSSDP